MKLILLLNDVFSPFLNNGFIRDILSALGLFLDFEVSDTYTLIYSIFLIIVALVSVVLFGAFYLVVIAWGVSVYSVADMLNFTCTPL